MLCFPQHVTEKHATVLLASIFIAILSAVQSGIIQMPYLVVCMAPLGVGGTPPHSCKQHLLSSLNILSLKLCHSLEFFLSCYDSAIGSAHPTGKPCIYSKTRIPARRFLSSIILDQNMYHWPCKSTTPHPTGTENRVGGKVFILCKQGEDSEL